MAEPSQPLPHVFVTGRVDGRPLARPPRGRGDGTRDRDRNNHGTRLSGELAASIAQADEQRRLLAADQISHNELLANGTVLVLEGSSTDFPLKLDSLERYSGRKVVRPQWLLLSVTPADEGNPERASIWVSDDYRDRFLKLFEDYIAKSTKTGAPKNRQLIANINRIRRAVLEDLWQSSGSPERHGPHWWEVWLRPSVDGVDLLRAFAEMTGATMSDRILVLHDRTVAWIEAPWPDLQGLPFTAVPIAEIRRPEFVDTVEELSRDEQNELAEDLAGRITPAPSSAPAVCHLDSGVQRGHVLLAGSLDPTDAHSVFGDKDDRQKHGTLMAGLALYGDSLDKLLLSASPVDLGHRIESVKIIPDRVSGDPATYGVVTAQAVALPEIAAPRQRVFCMPVTAVPDAGPGEPTLWSSSVDALAMGVDIDRDGETLRLLGAPNPEAARLFVISAGNVGLATHHGALPADYLDRCDLKPIQDPAQAWNALTVGAFTDLDGVSPHPRFRGWSSLAPKGELSPHSTTSVTFASAWPVKPDICMEGGNLLQSSAGDVDESHPLLTLRTTGTETDLALTSTNATSAATAQAARLAALTMARYPTYWPETVRGLLTHSAQWTPAMRARVDAVKGKRARQALMRRYGWGVPNEASLLNSTEQSVSLVVQDTFTPFDGPEHAVRQFRLHNLPWPADVLRSLGGTPVNMRVTLSYFIEPTASRRGWRRKYSYASHALRFDLKGPLETIDGFIARINQSAEDEEAGKAESTAQNDRWLIGPNQRNTGSLHQDIWENGSGPELAECGVLAVQPVGGWWKNNRRKDRIEQPVRYALIVSLTTGAQNIDLYTPIATELAATLPVGVAVAAT